MNIYDNKQRAQVYRVLLDGTQQVGTVKLLEVYHMVQENKMPE